MLIIAPCGLCLKVAELQRSHLLPAGTYRRLRENEQSNPNPVFVHQDVTVKTSSQVRQPFLCRDCENRFGKGGESWFLINCFQQDKSFPLQHFLARSTAVAHNRANDTSIYFSSQIPEIAGDKLLYFAASIFWRTAATSWNGFVQRKPVHIELGKYLEPLRLFLLDEADFPQHMTLQVYVSSWADNLELAMFPHEVTKTHLHRYRVTILGLTFILGVGNRISQNDCDACFVRSPLGGPVCVDPRMDVKIIEEAKRVAFASEAAKGLRILG